MSAPLRLSAADFRKRQGLAPPGQAAGIAKVGKPAIRMPSPVKMSKTEAEYERILKTEFPIADGYDVKFEAITLRLDGGNYTPDFSVWEMNEIRLFVECKGGYRLGSAGRSHMAFKAAIRAWPHIRFRFAQKSKDGWRTVES